MATTYTLISSTTVGSGGTAAIDFNSIPSTYTDLKVVLSLRGNAAAYDDYVNMRFNSSSGANYSNSYMYGFGTSPGVGTFTAQNYGYLFQIDAASSTSNTFSNVELYIPNYAGSLNKASLNIGVTENNTTGLTSRQNAINSGLWAQTTAISSINLSVGSSTLWVQYSSAYLYGISNA